MSKTILSLLFCGVGILSGLGDVGYTFHESANALVQLAFPRMELQVRHTEALRDALDGHPDPPRDLNEVLLRQNTQGRYINGPKSYLMPEVSLDSYWLSIHPVNDRAIELINLAYLEQLKLTCLSLLHEPWKEINMIEKALFQRDVFQLFFCLKLAPTALREDTTGDIKKSLVEVIQLVSDLLKRLTLSNEEIVNLRLDFQRALASRPLMGREFALGTDFLPLHDVSASSQWIEMRVNADDNRHFIHYRGRSFVKIFIKIPNHTEQDFHLYWDSIAKEYGYGAHLEASVPEIPARTHTLLLRTFGVFLENGDYVDSTIPEEVLIRSFISSRQLFDQNSSDYRGTYLYQYKMNRKLAINNWQNFGLKRRLEDDPSFVGFFSEVFDPGFARPDDNGLITTRWSCVSCHSKVLFGAPTIFSLEHTRELDDKRDLFIGEILRQGVNGKGTYRFVYEEFNLNPD